MLFYLLLSQNTLLILLFNQLLELGEVALEAGLDVLNALDAILGFLLYVLAHSNLFIIRQLRDCFSNLESALLTLGKPLLDDALPLKHSLLFLLDLVCAQLLFLG